MPLSNHICKIMLQMLRKDLSIMKTFNNLKPYQEPKLVESLRQHAQSNADTYGDKDFYVYKQNGETITVSYNDFNNIVSAFGTGLYK